MATILGCLVVVVGTLILSGWAFDVDILVTASASIAHTLPNTAVSFMVAGVSLSLVASRRAPMLSRALAGFVVLVAVITLAEHALDRNLGIDQLLISEDATRATDAPGRMRLATSISFTLIGISLIALSGKPRKPVLFQAGPIFVAGLAMLTLVGYAYGVTDSSAKSLTAWLTPMALYTSLSFLLLSAGVILSRPDTGFIAQMVSGGPGGAILRRLLLPTILLPVAGGFVRLRLQAADAFDTEYGTALFASSMVMVFVGAIWLTARSLDRVDAERRDVVARERAIFNSALDGLIAIDSDGVVLDVNPVAASMFGFSREDLVGEDMAELLIPKRSRAAHRAGLERLRGSPGTTSKLRLETVAKRSDGSEFDVEISIGQPGENATAAFVGNIRDISERKSLEHQLRQAQKLEAIGQLAGGVAHDFNNLLTVILGYVALAQEKTGSGAAAEDLEEVSKSTMRAVELTSQLLAFSRQQVLRTESLDLGEVIAGVEPMLKRLIGEDIEIVIYKDSRGFVLADRGQLEQIVINLAVNARDAMPTGGKILIETRDLDLGEGDSSTKIELKPGPYICLSVTDTGSGISREDAESIFDPFFTTKGVGKGTGLGLSTVHGIVTQSGGDVTFYSERGLGTSFKIYLPASTARPEQDDQEPRQIAERTGGHETILLCEDDETVRMLIDRILTKSGYSVISANGPHAAIDIAAEREGEIDMLVSDVIMPGMSGVELADHLNASGHAIPILLLSGYSAGTIQDRANLPVGSDFLEKPFKAAELLSRVRGMLDGDRETVAGDRDTRLPHTD